MAKTTETIVKNGLLYSIHNVSIDKGKKKIGTVECPKPTAETLEAFIDAKVVTYAELCLFYGKGKSVALQAELRRIASTGKMPQSEFNRLFAIHCDAELLAEAKKSEQNTMEWITEYLTVIWSEERDDAIKNETTTE